jgi:hypothetical protein
MGNWDHGKNRIDQIPVVTSSELMGLWEKGISSEPGESAN